MERGTSLSAQRATGRAGTPMTFDPGAAARMGLSFEALAPRKPGLIVCDISGYGTDGPYRDKNAYDLWIQSEAGL